MLPYLDICVDGVRCALVNAAGASCGQSKGLVVVSCCHGYFHLTLCLRESLCLVLLMYRDTG